MARPDLPGLVREVERTCRGSALERLATAVALSEELSSLSDALVGHFVEGAREGGASWAQIGVVLGVTKQAAQQRFVTPPSIAVLRPRGKRMPRAFTRRLRGGPGGGGQGPFERFDDMSRRALVLAQLEARGLGHGYLGTEHLLLGVAAEATERHGAERVEGAGLGLEAIRERVRTIIGEGSMDDWEGPIPFTPRAKKVLDLAWRESRRSEADAVGPQHLFLALIREGEGVAAAILTDMAADRGRTQTTILELLRSPA